MHRILTYNPEKDYYFLLGIRPDSNPSEIKKIWRKKAFETHPDRGETGNDEIQVLNEAYNILKDPEKKRVYDQKRALFIAATFKFKDNPYKFRELSKKCASDIENHLYNDIKEPWYRRLITFLSPSSTGRF